MKILVTGFDPFGEEGINPAIEAVKQLPDTILSIGQAGGRSDLSVERIGININDFRIMDNEGNQPMDECIFADGATAYFSNLPIKAMVAAIRKAHIPASISNTAGTFVCNHVFYGVRYLIDTQFPGKKSGFIHIPYLPQQVVDKPGLPSMALDVIVEGLTCALCAMIHHTKDIKTVEGSVC